MRTAATNRRMRLVLTGVRDGTLVPNPTFQRRLVWSNKHKVAFIQTVLEGLPFPEVFISAGMVDSETGTGTELIVDGQQRITTLLQYFQGSNDLKLGGLTPYAELEESQKLAFLEYEVVLRDLGNLTEDQTRDLFYRINSTSYALNAMEVNNARFDGELKQFCDRLSEHSFFVEHKIFSAYDAKRMNDVRYCLTLVITVLSTYFNRDSEHENYLERYNDEFPHGEEVEGRMNRTLTFIDQLELAPDSRAWQKSDLFTLIVVLYAVDTEGLDVSDVSARLNALYGDVDVIATAQGRPQDPRADEYFAATRSGTNDRSSRIRRGSVLQSVLELGDAGDFPGHVDADDHLTD